MMWSMVIKFLRPQVQKLGQTMKNMDEEYNSKDMCILIRKKKNDKGEYIPYLCYVEMPDKLTYLVDKETGKPIVKSVDGLIGVLTGSKIEETDEQQ